MDNLDDAKTIINVKGIVVRSYERAKKAANAANETMGSWLSRAMDQLANLEAGERYIPPASPANPVAVQAQPTVDLHQIAAVLMAMKETGLPVQKRVGQQINALLHGKLKEGREPTAVRRLQLNPKTVLLRKTPVPDPSDPDYSRSGIFTNHNCWKCADGEQPCARGNSNTCEFPRARND